MINKTLLAPTTEAAASAAFDVPKGHLVTIILHAALGLTASEYADLQISHDNKTSWQDVFQGTAQVRLHSTNNVITLEGPATYRLDKELSTNAAGITMSVWKV